MSNWINRNYFVSENQVFSHEYLSSSLMSWYFDTVVFLVRSVWIYQKSLKIARKIQNENDDKLCCFPPTIPNKLCKRMWSFIFSCILWSMRTIFCDFQQCKRIKFSRFCWGLWFPSCWYKKSFCGFCQAWFQVCTYGLPINQWFPLR